MLLFLVFSHTVRGPLAVPRDDLAKVEPPTNLINYVNGFLNHFHMAGERACENLEAAQSKMKSRFDRQAACRQFSPGDQVLALTPNVSLPFQAKFTL